MAEAKKQNWFVRTWGRICKYFRELRSELKKVVWPTPKQVLKNAQIVLACVSSWACSSGCSTSLLSLASMPSSVPSTAKVTSYGRNCKMVCCPYLFRL